MSTGALRRTRCQACGSVCRVRPTEVQIHGGDGHRAYWQWFSHTLCPPCSAAYRDYVRSGATPAHAATATT